MLLAVLLVVYFSLLSYVVLSRDIRSRTTISLIVSMGIIAAWMVGIEVLKTHLGGWVIVSRAVFALGLLTEVSLLWFVYELLQSLKVRSLLLKALPTLLVIVCAVAVVSLTTPLVVQDVVASTGSLPMVIYGPLFLAYFFVVVMVLGIVAIQLFVGVVRSRGIDRKRIRTVAISLFVAMMFVLATNLVLPILLDDTTAALLMPVGAMIMATGLSYAIVRHGLFDIKRTVIRTVAYAITLLTLAAIYITLSLLITNIVLQSQSEMSLTLAVNVVLALLLAFIFQPIRRFFDRITNKIFYRNQYEPQTFYDQLNEVLVSTTKTHELLRRASNLIVETFKVEHAFFALYRESGRTTQSGTGKYHAVPSPDLAVIDQVVSGIVVTDQLQQNPSLSRLLVSHRIGMVIPIERETRSGVLRVGYLFLGDHKGNGFVARDVKTLSSVVNELMIAIQNALSVQEVKDLNAGLEQRIDDATKELRRSNAQLQRLDEAKDEFISMASHQLRTPLTSVKGYISMLLEEDAGKISPKQKHLLNEAFISSERMVRLIGDFLNVSRLQTGKFLIEKRPTDLAKVVGEELESLLPNAEARAIKFVYKRPRTVPLLDLDESKIRQVIMNFADNAIYYSKDKTKIVVALSVEKNQVLLRVKDSGIGVPQAEQDRLFNKFFRATNARKQRPDGTGVGLFLAKKVVDAHNGTIIFESKENKGSTFGFSLPIPKTTKHSPAKQSEQPAE